MIETICIRCDDAHKLNADELCADCAEEYAEECELAVNSSDVEVVPLSYPCPECGGGGAEITHAVRLDLRSTGSSHEVYQGCAECCDAFAKRLRSSLPPPFERGDSFD